MMPQCLRLPLETKPTLVILRAEYWHIQSSLYNHMPSNNKHGALRKMKVLRAEDYWVDQITITPFSWCQMIPTRLRDKCRPASFNSTWSFSCWKKFNLEAHCRIDPHICRFFFLSGEPWYLVTAQPRGCLLDFSRVRQCCETNLWWSASR